MMNITSFKSINFYAVLGVLIVSFGIGTGGCQRTPTEQDQLSNTQTYDLDRKMAPLENLDNEEVSNVTMPADNSIGNITIKF